MATRRTRGRRSGGDTLTTIYWRDIPAQVTATIAGHSAKELLEPRFQHAIDRAAAVADLTETEAYVAQWRRDSRPITPAGATETATEGAADQLATQTVADLCAAYPRHRLEALVAQGGAELAPETQSTTTSPPSENQP